MTHASACDQASFSATLLDPGLPCPSDLRAWNGSDVAPRLAVYRNNVVSSLVDALADTFPVVQELVGVEFFRAMTAVFVRWSPPRTRILAQYGHALADFIAAFEPARSVPYLADMARLEFARVQAYHAADAPAVTSETVALALASDERMGELRLSCHSSVAVVRSHYAVVSLWAAHQGQGDIEAVDTDAGEDALVLREGLDVLVLRLPPGAAEFVSAIQRGDDLGNAAGLAAAAALDFDLSAILALLLGHGALTTIHLPQRLDA